MVRQTSLEAYNKIKSEGLLSERRWQVYDILFNHGPATGYELLINFKKKYGSFFGNSPQMTSRLLTSRLSELRDCGVAYEVRQRICSVTGMNVIEWDVTDRIPIKLDKPKKVKCEHCDGKGYFIEQQGRLF